MSDRDDGTDSIEDVPLIPEHLEGYDDYEAGEEPERSLISQIPFSWWLLITGAISGGFVVIFALLGSS